MKIRIRTAFLFAFLASCVALRADALQQTESFEIGAGAVSVVADPVTGRVFAARAGGRFGPGSVSVLEPDGRVVTIPTAASPVRLALSPKHRKLVVTESGFFPSTVTVVDADTLQVATAATGVSPQKAIVVESTGRAYVIGRNNVTGMPWENPGSLTGTLTEIDLRTNASRIFALPSMHPVDLAADAAGSRVYVIGSNYFRTGEPMPGFMNVLDTASGMLVHSALPLGRLPQNVAVSDDGSEVFVLGSVELVRTQFPTNDPRRNGARSAIHVLAAGDLVARRTILLPDTPDPVLLGNALFGSAAFDLAGGRVYAFHHGAPEGPGRLAVVDLASGAVRVAPLEGYVMGLGFNALTGQLIVAFPRLGYAGIFAADGERLDSVPLGSAAAGPEAFPAGIAVDARNGNAYLTNGHEPALVMLRAPETSALVNLTDLWWNPAESGWGLFLEHQGLTLFGALFVHAADGSPTWMVMSDGRRQADGSFAGALHRTSGPRERAIANLRAVGTMRFAPGAAGRATLSYDVEGATRTTTVERQRFNAAERTCRWSAVGPATAMDSANFTALWFNPAQPGWGLGLSQQGPTAFGVLFTFDAQDRATWTAMSNGQRQPGHSFAGELFRSKSSQAIQRVGSMELAFGEAGRGVLRYAVDGVENSSPIVRQVFAPLTTDCASP